MNEPHINRARKYICEFRQVDHVVLTPKGYDLRYFGRRGDGRAYTGEWMFLNGRFAGIYRVWQ